LLYELMRENIIEGADTMRNVDGYIYNLVGTREEIGKSIARKLKNTPCGAAQILPIGEALSELEQKELRKIYDDVCPGLSLELDSFAEEMKTNFGALMFNRITSLKPGCSQMVIQKGMSVEGKTIIARNYDFGVEMEDLSMVIQKIEGGMKHIASTIALFGRSDGMNEEGLSISLSSSGFPVGNVGEMRKPAVKGVQFWIAIRGVLENCKSTMEAVSYLKEIPLAYNANLILADKNNDCALFETYDGVSQYKFLNGKKDKGWLAATNHSLFGNTLERIKTNQDKLMVNSIVRYNKIEEVLSKKGAVSIHELEALLKTKYPEGLLCHYYPEFFGTIRSMIMVPEDRTMRVCLGSSEVNEWLEFNFAKNYQDQILKLFIPDEKAPKGFFDAENYNRFNGIWESEE